MGKPATLSIVATLAAFILGGCGTAGTVRRSDYAMGEPVTVGPLTYTVVESVWRTQLGELFRIRTPQKRFLLITISVTNAGNKDVSIPLLALEGSGGKSYLESENGDGVDNWFGIFRNVSPTQTQQGRLLFDVPLTDHKLRLTDGGDPGAERYAWVKIPLRMDIDSSVEAPLPGEVSRFR